MTTQPNFVTLHATSVAIGTRGLLIVGASGSGKSGIALEMMARGAQLVSDDQTLITAEQDGLWMTAPDAIRGMIEARFVGLLAADPIPRARLMAMVDLDLLETDRLPALKQRVILGQTIPLFQRAETAYFSAALVQFLKAGRKA